MRGGLSTFKGISEDNVIALLSDFKAGSGAEGGFSRNSTYTDCQWMLIKDSKTDKWKVVGWGY